MSLQTGVETSLGRIEAQTLEGVHSVEGRLHRALRALRADDRYLTTGVRIDNRQLAASQARVRREVLTLLGSQDATVRDVRIAAAVLNLLPCIAHMADQCLALAELVSRLDRRRLDRLGCNAVERIGELTRSQVLTATLAFASRDAELAERQLRRHRELGRPRRELLARASALRADAAAFDQAMELVGVTICLQRIADSSIEIAEQTVLVVTDGFEEIAYAAA